MNKENQLVEIDVLSLIKTVWKRKFIILLTALVAAVLALGYSLFIAKPSYQSRHGFMLSTVSRQIITL